MCVEVISACIVLAAPVWFGLVAAMWKAGAALQQDLGVAIKQQITARGRVHGTCHETAALLLLPAGFDF